ncbi:MAG: hypothetical protein GY842_04140 [bacterium]|nr:hypothetical protein [bacterium]
MSTGSLIPAAARVLKLGGSVLTDTEAYRRCAEVVTRRLADGLGEPIVVVVSAELGTTDRLRALAGELCPKPSAAMLDLLWSTGELESVARLTLCLHRLGEDAVGLNVHQCGLVVSTSDRAPLAAEVYPTHLRYYLERHRVVVVPGFLARGPFDSVVSLGRGASDLTAVCIAAAVGSGRCELIKDVPGYYSEDPNVHVDAQPLPRLSYADALRMAAEGCDLVQAAALEAAAHHGVTLVIGGVDPASHHTVVGNPSSTAGRSAAG